MAIDFPDSPSNNDIYTVNGKRWIYSSGKWSIYGSTAPDATASDTEPTGVGDGHIWYRSDQSQTLIRYDNTWVEIGSAGGFDNASTNFPTSIDSGTGFAAVEAIETALLDGAPLHIDDANERVGVGNVSPSYKLDVTGDINATGVLRVAGVEFGPVNEFTPAWNNLTVGDGTTVGWWATRGEIAIVYAYIEFGSTSSMLTNPFLPIGTNGLPTPSTYGEYHYISDVILEEVGVQTLRGLLKWRDGNIAPVTALTSGTYMNQSAISGTVPFTWGNGDFMSILTMYRRA